MGKVILESQRSSNMIVPLSILPGLCLLPNVKGGFEVDGPVKVKQANSLSAAPGKTTSKLQRGNSIMSNHFVTNKIPLLSKYNYSETTSSF